jgi:glycosidase
MEFDDATYTAGQKLLLAHVKKLTKLRKQHPALSRGDRTTLSVDDETYAYEKVEGDDRVIVVINRSDDMQDVTGVPDGEYTDLLTDDPISGGTIAVPPRRSLLLAPQ